MLPRFALEEVNLVEDAENLIWVDRPQRKVVVGIAAVIKMKTAQHIL